MQIWFDRQGQPIDAARANDLLADTRYVRVAMTHITSSSDPAVSFDVSTVWLGCNYGLHQDQPVLFETMVFGGSDDQDQTMWRYSTEAEAIAGHREIVASVAATVTNEIVTDEVAPAPLPEHPASVLDRIDDVLADWRGSADAMHWSPDDGQDTDDAPGPDARTLMNAIRLNETTMPVLRMADSFQMAMRQLATSPGLPREDVDTLADELFRLLPFSLEMTFPLSDPAPDEDYWAAQATLRSIGALFDVPPRAIGFTPRYGLDARYQQRQRNRRKRR